MLIDENQFQAQNELAAALNVTQQYILQYRKGIGIIRKSGNWLPHELTEKDIQRQKIIREFLLQRQKIKGFLRRIVTGDRKLIHYDNQKRKTAWVKPGESGTSTPKQYIHGSNVMLYIWWD